MTKETKKDWKAFKEESDRQDELEHEDAFEENTDELEKNNPVLEHPSYLALEEKLTLAEQKGHENWEKAVRAMAELDNVRRRAERDVTNAHRYALEKFASALLAVVDSLEQAIQLAEEHLDESMRDGLALTMKLFLDVLEKHGVQQLNPQGEAFDPQQHEAMSMQEANGAAPNSVLVVLQKGYMLNDRVIRPARVIVARG